jgi:tRNA(Ser,Leu) C12 N-acetylase TAN1
MVKFAEEMGEEGGTTFLTLKDECVPFEHVARIYIDTQENEYVAIIEDSSSASYIIERGTERRCRAALEEIATAIMEHMSQRRANGNSGPTAAMVQGG